MAAGNQDQDFFSYSLIFYFIITPLTVISLCYITTPYGKHHRPGWGPSMPAALAWFLMESPTLWFTVLLFPLGQHHSDPKAQLLISIFLAHYFHRTIIYPLRLFIKSPRRQMTNQFPVIIAALAFFFNLFNSYVQTRWVSHYADYSRDKWFWWRFPGGLVVFVIGMTVNIKSDYKLLGLKSVGGSGYKIPKEGWFELVSCPNYFGETLEWLGWALMNWSWAGLAFLLYTCANLVPRAVSHHKWYLEKFGEDYPKNRKIVFPFLY